MAQRANQSNCFSVFYMAIAVWSALFLFTGCQLTSPQADSLSDAKSVAQIAQESMKQASQDGKGEFETLQNPNAAPTQTSRPPATRVNNRRSRPARAPGPNSRVLVDEIFDQTDVREALQVIASQANVSIIVDDQVAGSITALIQNEPLEQALRKILLPLGLHYRVVNGEYLVCNADPTSSMFSIVSDRLDYSPIYTAPSEMVELLAEKNRQFVRIAPKRNMLIIEAPTDIANQIMNELRLFDQPVPQVVLEAMVVVVSPDSGFQFGSNLRQGITSAEGGDTDFNLALDELALSGSISGAVVDNLFRRFAVTSFFVRALEQEGYLSIRATPHVMAKHGEKAEISIARETFFSTQPNDSSQFFRQDIQKVEAGISLIITPTIRGDNVTMLIEKAEVSEDIRATVSDPAVNNPFPLINRRQVSTTVNVKDGETIVIGGLMQNQLVDRVSSVPILSSVPLIGRFFRQKVQEEQAAEVVVFISPRVVNNAGQHPMAGAEEVAQSTDEFWYQRRFPRNNGYEIGGPGVVPVNYQEPIDDGYYQQPQYQQPQYQQQFHQQQLQYQSQPPQQYQQPQYQHPQYQQQNPSYPPVNYRGNEHYQAAPQTQQFHPYSSPIPPPVSQYAPAYQRPQSPVAATPANGSVSQMQSRYTQPQYQQSQTQIDVSQDQELVLTADPTNAVRQQPAIANSNSAKTYAVEQASYQQPAATVSQ